MGLLGGATSGGGAEVCECNMPEGRHVSERQLRRHDDRARPE